MRTSIRILATTLLCFGSWTAFGSGSGEVGTPKQLGDDSNAERKFTPEQQAKTQYNSGVKLVGKGDDLMDDAARQTDAKKQAKLTEKAKAHYAEALKKFLKATELTSGFYEAWNYVGYTSRMNGDYEGALLAYDRALSLKPGFPEAVEYRGHAFLALNRLSEAKEAYLQLYSGNRKLAAKLLTAMQAWVGEHRANAGGIDTAMLDSFASWVKERGTIAGQTVGLTREGAASAW